MIYGIHLHYDLELQLRRLFGGLSEKEQRIYDSIRELNSISSNGASLQELCAGRRRINETYKLYFSCDENRYKVFFHSRLKELRVRVDSRIKTLEETEGVQEST